jgi:hypothetical protein
MKRRDLLKSALLAIPGVGWLMAKAGAGVGTRTPKPLEFAYIYARVAWNRVAASWSAWDGEAWVVRTGLAVPRSHYRRHAKLKGRIIHRPVLEVRFPTGSTIPLIPSCGEYFNFHLMWHKDEWWVLWDESRSGHLELPLDTLKRYPEENKPFIDAFADPNYVIIDPFSKTRIRRG